MSEQIHVTSHVARDLLQTAAVFKTDKQVVWEYVSNSLQYSQPGRPARVEVKIQPRQKKITISDNGRGMDWSGLQNFWTLHGQKPRSPGRPAGTGPVWHRQGGGLRHCRCVARYLDQGRPQVDR
jgi:hypothetical protein